MIEVKHLTKDYGSHHALKDVSFQVKDGGIVGLLGPNGAGKTTTMNILTGFISPTSGQVEIGGYNIEAYPLEAKKQIGYLPEIPPLYEDMTVEEYLRFVCGLKGINKKADIRTSVEEAEKAAGLSDVRKRLIRNLSKGYKQRTGIAQALLGNPPLLILDEPTVGLDPNQIMEVRSLIRSLGGKHTVILSSHILSEVNAVCDQVLILDKGALVAEDTPDSLAGDLAPSAHILLTVKGTEDKINEILSNIHKIEKFEITGENEGMTDVSVLAASGQDIRDDLFFAFAEKKLPVIKMEMEKLSLEEVFMKLTGQEEEKKAAGAKHKDEEAAWDGQEEKEEKEA